MNHVKCLTAYANRFINNLKKINTPREVPTANEIEISMKHCMVKVLTKKTLR